jgi:hypothetical protein
MNMHPEYMTYDEAVEAVIVGSTLTHTAHAGVQS